MVASKRNPVVDLVKAALGLSSAGKCSCGVAAVVEVAEQAAVPDQPVQAAICGCGEQATSAPSEQNACDCSCRK